MPIPFLPFEPPKYLQRTSPTVTTTFSNIFYLFCFSNSSFFSCFSYFPYLFCFSNSFFFSYLSYFSNQDIFDLSLFPPVGFTPTTYKPHKSISREPLFQPPNLLKEKLRFQVQHLHPSPPPSFSFCLAISVHFNAKAVKGLNIAVCRNIKDFKIKILNHTCSKSYNFDIALLMLIVIAVQYHSCTYST